MRRSVVLLCLGVGGTAAAKGAAKPIVDADHVIDESSVVVELDRDGGGYKVRVEGYAMGVAKDDQVRLEIRHGGKTVTDKCANDEGGISCHDGTILKGAGAIEADLIVHADADDKEYVLRTFKVNAKNWDGKGAWQIEADDLLGPAYFVPERNGPVLRFWVANSAPDASALRCKVDGKPLPDIEGRAEGQGGFSADITKGNSRTTWTWTQVGFKAERWSVAKKGADVVSLEEHPGTWECQLRHDGVGVREFKFVVGKGGTVESSGMGNAKGAPKLPPGYAMIENKILKGNGVDQRIKPDQIKKSRGFGMPWPQDDGVKTMLASLPAAYENANPVAEKPKGKLVDGSTTTPPRFVEPSSVFIQVIKSTSGVAKGVYTPYLKADVRTGQDDSKSNKYRLLWKQNGKVLGTIDCGSSSDVECKDTSLTFKATGPIEAQLIMYDDQDGNDYALRTFKVNVAKFTSADKDEIWSVVPDDLLGTAWISGLRDDAETIGFRFWTATKKNRFKLRCTADGQKVPDFGIGGFQDDPDYEAKPVDKKGNTLEYVWQYTAGNVDNKLKPGLPPKDYKRSNDYIRYLGEYPGNWSCDVRDDSKVVRVFKFHVNDKGYVDPDPAQLDAAMAPDVVPIEVHFGKEAQDVRVRPDAMKKSRAFGLPWPKGAPKDLPTKASGLPDPK